jgi:hypothetical protein
VKSHRDDSEGQKNHRNDSEGEKINLMKSHQDDSEGQKVHRNDSEGEKINLVKSRHYEMLPEIVSKYERMHILRRAFDHICTFGPPESSPRSKQHDDPSSSLLSFWVMKRNATFITEGQQKPYFVLPP